MAAVEVEPGYPTVAAFGEQVGSVTNAARLLREFVGDKAELGVTELSRRLGIGKSTVHRLVSTLTAQHLLEQDAETGRYRLAMTMYDLGQSVSVWRELHQAAVPVVAEVRARCGLSVHVGVRNGRYMSYLERNETDHGARSMNRHGTRVPVNVSAGGRVLLAALSRPEVDEVLYGWRLPAKTPRSVTEHAALRLELARTRLRGYSVVRDEFVLGATSLAVPICGVGARVDAALSIGGATASVLDNEEPFVRLLTEAATRISRRLVGVRVPEPSAGRQADPRVADR